jgi:hypothetical protein
MQRRGGGHTARWIQGMAVLAMRLTILNAIHMRATADEGRAVGSYRCSGQLQEDAAQ